MSFKNTMKGMRGIALVVCMIMCCNIAFSEVVDKVIVVVNEEVVTQREFDRMFAQVQQAYGSSFKGDELKARLEEARKGILEQLINSKLAISLAKKAKMKIDEAEITKRIDSIKAYYPTEDEFLQALNAKGTNLTEFERDLRDQMLAQKFVEKEVASQIIITPGEMQELYSKNQEKFMAPTRAQLRGILVRKVEGSDEPRKKAVGLLKEVKSGKDFADVATENSEGPYAEKGGEMGYIAPGQTLPEIDQVVFKMKKGDISEIVETQIGYHIFKVEDITESKQLSFDEVSDFLKQQLHMKKFEEDLLKWLEAKRKNAYISYK